MGNISACLCDCNRNEQKKCRKAEYPEKRMEIVIIQRKKNIKKKESKNNRIESISK